MKRIGIIAGAGALAISALATAQVHGGSGFEHGGKLTRQQAAERADQMFRRFDGNRDGRITRAESQQAHLTMQREMAGRHAGQRRAYRGAGGSKSVFDRILGGRQAVTAAEFRQRHLALFASLDRNRDGVIAGSEHQGARAWMNH